MTELKPCPFCGSRAYIKIDVDKGFHIECVNCPIITRPSYYEDLLVDAWNRRDKE